MTTSAATRQIDLCYVPLAIGHTKPKEDYDKYLTSARDESVSLNGDEVVISGPIPSVILHIEYCLGNPARFRLKADDPARGFTRLELVRGVIQTYERVYEVEKKTSTIPPGMMSPWVMNRNSTNGKYCISMHVLEDLMLHTAYYDEKTTAITLDLDS